MPENLNTLLDSLKNRTEELVKEIKQYKSSKDLNQKSTESLESVSKTLTSTIKKIKPYTESRMEQFQLAVLIALGVNLLMLIVVLYYVLSYFHQ